eukprot:gene4151-7461_t
MTKNNELMEDSKFKSKTIDKLTYHNFKPYYLHFNILPFFFIYCLTFISYLQVEKQRIIILIIFGFEVLIQLFLSLLCLWNLNLRIKFQYSETKNVKDAKYIFVQPKEHKGQNEICEIIKEKNEEEKEEISFEYQKRKYKFNSKFSIFKKIEFPIKKEISFYKNQKGIQNEEEEEKIKKEFGLNKLIIPIPKLIDLVKEQAIQPFFIFQIFCVFLWMLDEYWYYSLFTLVMLFLFEIMVASQRFRNINMIRSMSPEPKLISVFRKKKWIKIMTDEILPNDLISIYKMNENEVSPCDILLLDGKCVVNEALLTGESTPQMKENINQIELINKRNNDEIKLNETLNMKKYSKNIIFSGTRVLLSENSEKTPNESESLGFVLRTGFETSQGKLIRTILFSNERVTANNREALLFILILLIFAIISSVYVLITGLNEKRNLFKLILNCVMIITSVVPPELPMELTLAVNNSLMILSKLGIFCTEPFRIPIAGKVEICCFDKTGTLTSDKMILKGVYSNKEDKMKKVNSDAKLVLSGCNSLISLNGEIIGDPMELAGLNGSGDYSFSTKERDVLINNLTKKKFKILKRFQFSSELKRMSSIISFEKDYFILTKGAPEILKDMFSIESIPKDYDELYKSYMKNGSRVIALGIKKMKNNSISMSRNEVEKDLNFCGFAIFHSDIKKDTFETIQNLIQSSHKVIMITGDNILTAEHVGKELKIIQNEFLILSKNEKNEFHWLNENDEPIENIDENKYDLGISGDILSLVVQNDSNFLKNFVDKIKIYARVSPDQKQLILTKLKENNLSTLMCGDGTNDVGALKQSDVGVALLDDISDKQWNSLFKKSQNKSSSSIDLKKDIKKIQKKIEKKNTSTTNNNLNDLLKDLQEEESGVVRLGDASIASPFTSKTSSILSTSHIIRQGRCALVTTIQMYKILAINSLISAYSLSVQYMEGIKFGDLQMMYSGLFIAIIFLFISRSESLEKLSSERPHSSIFSPYVLLSILGQFILNLICLIYLSNLAKTFIPIDLKIDPESDFKPNILNSVVFLVSTTQTLFTFFNNYKGHPFMSSITENRGLFSMLSMATVGMLLLIIELSPEINNLMELTPLPLEFKNTLYLVLFLNISIGYIYEKILIFIFKK